MKMGPLKLHEQLEINGGTALLSKGQMDTLQLNVMFRASASCEFLGFEDNDFQC